MANRVENDGLYLGSQIQKMFDIQTTKTALLNAEEKGLIPKADRLKRGKASYRAWTRDQLPLIGEKLGFLKRPENPTVISVFSLKGGTGKTSMAFQLARTSALHNIRTIVIGLDAQESITQTLNKRAKALSDDAPEPEGLYQILAEGADVISCVQKTDLPSLDFIPETIELSILDHWLKNQKRKEYIIKERLVNKLLASGKYDQIIFDCNPAWSDVVNGALGASDILISPLGADINSFKAAKIFVELLDEFQEDMKHEFDSFIIIPTMVENNKLSQTILARYRVDYGELTTVASVKRSVTIQEANVLGKSMLEVGFNSPAYPEFVNVLREVNASIVGVEIGVTKKEQESALVEQTI